LMHRERCPLPVTTGLVPVAHNRDRWRGGAEVRQEPSVFLGGRDKPGHDDPSSEFQFGGIRP
jgi:hypothetical protein